LTNTKFNIWRKTHIQRKYDYLSIYTDGASRGNPGPAAAAFKILNDQGVNVRSSSRLLGKKTNNEAEYEALIYALQEAQKLTKDNVCCYLDSELVVKQLNGEYQVANPRLKTLWMKIRVLEQEFQHVYYNHVARTNINIEDVDKLANRTLNRSFQ
jgi:ribonuclease HI